MSESALESDLISLGGQLIQEVRLVFTLNSRAKPDIGKACWILVDCEGEYEWEFAEWQDGSGTLTEGWYLIGDHRPIDERDYRVRAWCYPPAIPQLPCDSSVGGQP